MLLVAGLERIGGVGKRVSFCFHAMLLGGLLGRFLGWMVELGVCATWLVFLFFYFSCFFWRGWCGRCGIDVCLLIQTQPVSSF